MHRSTWISGVVVLAAGTALAQGDRMAVVAAGTCDDAAGISARSFRSALSTRTAGVLAEADTAQPFGGTTDRTLPALTTAIAGARSDFYARRAAEAARTLRGVLDDLARQPPSDGRWAAEKDALTLLAQVLRKTDRAGSDAALARILRVEPDYRPDTGNYPPSFQRVVDAARKTARRRATSRFEVTTSPAGKPVYVGGRRMGAGPLVLRLPAGDYRVEADWGHRGAARTATVPASAPVELSAAVEGAVFPDGGPCIEAPDLAPALARVATATRAGRVLAARTEGADPERFAVVTSADARGEDVREARVRLAPGAPSGEAFAALAGWASGGDASAPVEVTRGPGARPPPVVAAAPASGPAAPSAALAPAPAATVPASSGYDADGTHFEAAVRVGYAVPFGDIAGNSGSGSLGSASLKDYANGSIPVGGDIGVRLGGHVFLGAYVTYGFGGSTDASACGSGFSCTPRVLRVGGEVHWHPLGNVGVDPWIGLGSGYERLEVSVSGSGSGSVAFGGWEFANVQLGVDFGLGNVVKLGPWVSGSVGQYGTASVTGNSGGSISGDVQDKKLHGWVMGGVRLVLVP